MARAKKKERSALLPIRHEADLFFCDIFDAAPKSDMAPMEHPIFSLSTKPDMKVRKFKSKNGRATLELRPSYLGLATIHDRDVLIFVISQLIAGINEGRSFSRNISFHAYDLLVATNRPKGGSGYLGLKAALERLQGTQLETNILTGGFETLEGFSLIDSYKIVRETREGRMLELEVRLSDWMSKAINAKEVLTLHRDYFRLRKPLERRLYEIARKHCGQQSSWRIGLDTLHIKSGSGSRLKEFRRMLTTIVRQDELKGHIPDYSIRLKDDDIVEFRNRRSMPPPLQEQEARSVNEQEEYPLADETIATARKILAGWDVYAVHQEWVDWIVEPPRNAQAAFLGFCRKWVKKRGLNPSISNSR